MYPCTEKDLCKTTQAGVLYQDGPVSLNSIELCLYLKQGTITLNAICSSEKNEMELLELKLRQECNSVMTVNFVRDQIWCLVFI